MSFGDRFLNWLNTVVTLEAFLGINAYGDRTYDTLRYYRTYIDESGTLIRDKDGQQIVDSASVYLHPLEVNADGTAKIGGVRLTAIHEDSRLGIPDANQQSGWAYPVLLKVDALNSETGETQIYVLHT